MAAQPPDGEPVPDDGALPAQALAEVGRRPFGVYVHVPFCASRCGYCDFNTYVSAELGPGGDPDSYVDAALAELRLAGRVLGGAAPVARTVFFGGGTPTLLPPAQLARLLDGVADTFGLADDAEVTTEANPESVDAAGLGALREAGFTRVSFGMQSARAHVLRVLDRRHTPGRAAQAVAEARAAGFAHVSLDLIYGTPGESADDWLASLDAAVAARPDHISAYALVVEDGTAMAGRVRRGLLPAPDDDVLADRYEAADARLSAAGFDWYEVSNWARPGGECRHNRIYWRNGDWWGVGPGAHSHVAGVRWWNVRRPAAYADRLGRGLSPGQGREVLDAGTRQVERVLLGTRLSSGHPVTDLPPGGAAAARRLAGDGLIEPPALDAGTVRLTLRGRLLADVVVRDLLD